MLGASPRTAKDGLAFKWAAPFEPFARRQRACMLPGRGAELAVRRRGQNLHARGFEPRSVSVDTR